jgi:hypothetical protein
MVSFKFCVQSSLKVTLAAKCALIRSQPPCKRVGEPNFIIRASKGDCKSQTFSEGSKVYGLETELAAHTWKASFSRVCTQKISLMWKAQKRRAVALNAEHRHQLKAAAFSISWNEFADLAKGRKGSLALSSLSLSLGLAFSLRAQNKCGQPQSARAALCFWARVHWHAADFAAGSVQRLQMSFWRAPSAARLGGGDGAHPSLQPEP